tara:strand:+ start:191 stop:853 length:663 start_codon:yes stop_codon:yes gene_type:complete
MAILDTDPIVIAVLAAFAGMVIGLVMKKIIEDRNARNSKNMSFNGKQLEAWFLPPEWANILLEKDPVEKAKAELEVLKRVSEETEADFQENVKKLNEVKQGISSTAAEIRAAETNAEKLALANGKMPWFMAELAKIRRKTEFLVNASIPTTWREEFLTLVKMNRGKDGIVSQMNSDDTSGHIKNPYTKNMELMESEWRALTNDNTEWTDELLTNLFGIES